MYGIRKGINQSRARGGMNKNENINIKRMKMKKDEIKLNIFFIGRWEVSGLNKMRKDAHISIRRSYDLIFFFWAFEKRRMGDGRLQIEKQHN